MRSVTSAQPGITYLDMQAYVGITKHIGDRAATDELLALCHIERAHEVLNVGCGIGIGCAYLAKKHGCRVVGVDISEKMIEWSRKRAHNPELHARNEPPGAGPEKPAGRRAACRRGARLRVWAPASSASADRPTRVVRLHELKTHCFSVGIFSRQQ